MSDVGWEMDDEWQDVDDWDDPSYVKDEPDCYACCDSGLIFNFDRGTARRCRACRPSFMRRWWRRTRSWIYWRFRARRARQLLSDGEGPF